MSIDLGMLLGMCGRFAQTPIDEAAIDAVVAATAAPRSVAEEIGAHLRSELARDEVRPGDEVVLLACDKTGRIYEAKAAWGVASARVAAGSRKQKGSRHSDLIHARSERLASSPFWNHKGDWSPCLILASSFSEWGGPPGQRVRYRVSVRGTFATMVMAGLTRMEKLPKSDGSKPRFVILTRPATDPLLTIHDRMPLLLDLQGVSRWLGPSLEARRAYLRSELECDGDEVTETRLATRRGPSSLLTVTREDGLEGGQHASRTSNARKTSTRAAKDDQLVLFPGEFVALP